MYWIKLNDCYDFNSTIKELNEDLEVLNGDVPKEYPCIMVCNTVEGFDGVDKIDYILIYKSNF